MWLVTLSLLILHFSIAFDEPSKACTVTTHVYELGSSARGIKTMVYRYDRDVITPEND